MSKRARFERRVAIFSADTLARLSELGVRIDGGSGRVFADLEIPEENEKKVWRLLKREGFDPAGPESGPATES